MIKLSDIFNIQIERRITSQNVSKKSDSYYGEKQMSQKVSNSVKTKMLAYLSKNEGYNTLTTAQAQARFGITNVAARIDELRKEGHAIYTNTKRLKDGRKITFYKMGKPSMKVVAAGVEFLRLKGERAFA